MTTIKIRKSAKLENPRHDMPGQRTLYHDGIVCMVIQKMRRLGMRLVDYDETPDSGPVRYNPTIMKFRRDDVYIE